MKRGGIVVNINGKEWSSLEPADIQTIVAEQDFDESFYFEFKDDKVSTKKLMEEVSAFANTFGGYIFLGISDDKQIEGCTVWDEQRIHTTFHDSITPTPSFDVKRFTCDGKTVYVIKIDEGAEPPYITSSGKIYERLSSGSFTIKDSVRLSQIYNKREQLHAKMETKISIPPVTENVNNIYGYIDTGFVLVLSDVQAAFDIFDKLNLKDIANNLEDKTDTFNLARIGNSILYTPGGLSTETGKLPAHANNFLEIMADGSARMRVLLINNDPNNSTVNMLYASTILGMYKKVYTYIMTELLPDKMVYAKKYESLTVRRQFHPAVFYDDSILDVHPNLQGKSETIIESIRKYRSIMGRDIVVTNDRIPKTGLYTIDKRQLENWHVDYTAESIIDELFYSRFTTMGTAPMLDNDDTLTTMCYDN